MRSLRSAETLRQKKLQVCDTRSQNPPVDQLQRARCAAGSGQWVAGGGERVCIWGASCTLFCGRTVQRQRAVRLCVWGAYISF